MMAGSARQGVAGTRLVAVLYRGAALASFCHTKWLCQLLLDFTVSPIAYIGLLPMYSSTLWLAAGGALLGSLQFGRSCLTRSADGGL